MKKIAVILRGHRRVWNSTKNSIFDFFRNKADIVDYYVSWWQTGDLTEETLRKDFAYDTLKAFYLPAPDKRYLDPYYAPSYLSNLVIPNILKEEFKNGEYDMVIETRPDVTHYIGDNIQTVWQADNSSIGFTTVNKDEGVVYALTDHCYIAKSKALLLYNQKLCIDIDPWAHPSLRMGHHTFYVQLMDFFNLRYYQIPWFDSIIVRPTIIDFENNIDGFYKSRDSWNMLTKKQKIEYVMAANIPLNDYDYHIDMYTLN